MKTLLEFLDALLGVFEGLGCLYPSKLVTHLVEHLFEERDVVDGGGRIGGHRRGLAQRHQRGHVPATGEQ